MQENDLEFTVEEVEVSFTPTKWTLVEADS